MMKLIADSGATKTHWVLLENDSKVNEFYSPGFNPYYYEKEKFNRSLQEVLKTNIRFENIGEVHFYGSGISSEENHSIVRNSLYTIFPRASISVYHDLHGAAIALLGRKKGIACILGTGSNSCLWDGEKILANVPSLGYFLGDEGSGTYLGKLLITDILIGDADPEIASLFYKTNNLTFSKTLDRIYKEDNPNRFFSAQAKFIRELQENVYCKKVIVRNFEDFIKVQLSKYPGYQFLPVCFTGSVATNFKDILVEVLNKHSISLGTLMKEPMDGMVRYHLGRDAI